MVINYRNNIHINVNLGVRENWYQIYFKHENEIEFQLFDRRNFREIHNAVSSLEVNEGNNNTYIIVRNNQDVAAVLIGYIITDDRLHWSTNHVVVHTDGSERQKLETHSIQDICHLVEQQLEPGHRIVWSAGLQLFDTNIHTLDRN